MSVVPFRSRPRAPDHAPLTRPKPPWSSTTGLSSVIDRWLESRYVQPCFTADETLEGAPASYAPFPEDLPPPLRRVLEEQGVQRLYAHQARAFGLARAGRPYVVATPTASGKSLCFHLPVLTTLAEDPDARALYLFPTKALARDQEAALRALLAGSGLPTGAIVYDGDTPGDARRAARERSAVIMTNPDMLHTGVLPHHTQWARLFQNLRYVVVDELHTYRGVFGSHVANVLRRLLRVARFHGSSPVLVGATATIGNPREHAARLFGVPEEDMELVAESGAPRGARRFFLFNPPVVNAELGIRASYVKQAVMLAADLVRAKVPTIVFGQSRNSVEVMLRYLRDRIARGDEDGGPMDPSRVMAYRGGYLPGQRREIERKLRDGELLCVIATNALELGIDVGALDAVICAGYPGSVAALWQRFGRAGRRGHESVCIMVSTSAPLDQFLARDPSFLLGAPVEEARIDPDNVEILVQHLKCAAFEMPFRKGETFGHLSADETADALGFLVSHNVLHEAGGGYHWAADAYPANNVSLRSIGWDNVVIIDVERGRNFAELDWRAAHTMLHEQAIYQHDGETYQVERFDYENHKAYVRKVVPDYYTDAMTHVQISVLEEEAVGPLGADERASAGWGEVSVVEKVVGYKKIRFFTHENVGYGEVHLPEMQMHTTALWLTIPEERCATFPAGRAALIDALRGVGLAFETVATLALMCDPRDLGTTLGEAKGGAAPPSSEPRPVPRRGPGGPRPGYDPTLFVYEHVPGGTGLAERMFRQRDLLLARTLRLIETCPCPTGCPSCVGPVSETSAPHDRKRAALELLRPFVR